MFMSNEELKTIMSAYGFEDYSAVNHYEVGPDTWVYLFEHENKKYVLVTADYLGDYEFDTFPHLLKFDDNEFEKIDFVLRSEVPIKDESLLGNIRSNTTLFEYSN